LIDKVIMQLENDNIDILVSDEAGFNLEILPGKGWDLIGKPLQIPHVTKGNNITLLCCISKLIGVISF
jgi:hypothetical protein